MSADSFLASESSIGFDQPIPKQSMTLQDMMDEVSQMDALAEDGVVPLAVQLLSPTKRTRDSQTLRATEKPSGVKPLWMGAGPEQEMSH